MYTSSLLLSLALSLPAVQAQAYQGFNYGSTNSDNSVKTYNDFRNEFTTAQNLVGTSGFTSARLYTMIQGGTTNTPIEALQAAIDTDTSLLLGLWASGDSFPNELAALRSAISQFPQLSSSIAGISVGSEDLYRVSPTGIENMSGIGAGPSTIVDYIQQVRSALSGTSWQGVSIGHVDTWNAWANSSNSDVVSAVDWIGVDEYPYFQNTQTNDIGNGRGLFEAALAETQANAQGKEIWITETGWPLSGPVENLGVASTANAKTYWDEVGCPRFGSTNIWWYTLQDAYPTTPSPSFGVVGSTLSTTPLYDLSCSNVTNSSSSSTSSSASASGTAVSSAAGTGSGSGAATVTAAGTSALATSGGLSPSGAGAQPVYANSTLATSAATAAGTGSSGALSTGSASSGSSSGSGSGSGSSSGSGSDSGSSTGSGAASTSSVMPYTGSAATFQKGSAIGILAAVGAAVLLL